MSDKEIINPGTPVAGPYSPGIRVGNLLFVSGQGSAQGAADIKEQTATTLEKLKIIVESAGGKVSDIVSTIVYLKDMKDFGKMNRAYQKFFDDNGVTEGYPSRATVEVSNLPLASMLIEISAIAVI